MRQKWFWPIGASVVVCAVVAAGALAATTSLSGHVSGSSSSFVKLKVVIKHKAPVKVTQFGAHAPAKCHAGPPFATAGFPKALTVASNGTFKGQAKFSESGGVTVTFKLSGKVAKNGKSASGTLNIDKKAPLPIGECKTGNRHWSAKA